MSYVSPGSFAGRRQFNILLGGEVAPPPPPVAEIIQTSLTVTYGGGGAGDFSAAMDITANPVFLVPTIAGTSAIIRFIFNEFASVTEITDNLGGSLTGGQWGIASVPMIGPLNAIHHYGYRHDNPGGIHTITVTKNTPFTSVRIYFTEVANLLNNAPVAVYGNAGASVSTCAANFDGFSGAFATSMQSTGAGRVPLTNDIDAAIQRLNFNFFGGNWVPYSGNVNEYGMNKVVGFDGAQSLDSYWLGGNTQAEFSTCVFGVV